MEKEIYKELQRIYERISDIEAKDNLQCDKCKKIIFKGTKYFKTKIKEIKNGKAIDKDILILCSDCFNTRWKK